MTRSELREHCFKMLFCADFYPGEEAAEQIERYFESPVEDGTTPEGVEEILHQVAVDVPDTEYLKQKVGSVIQRIGEIDGEINAVAQGWKTRRMGKVELTILRLALFEMRHDGDVPEKVAINEAVELAKKFGQEESPAFVNGILAKLVRDGDERQGTTL